MKKKSKLALIAVLTASTLLIGCNKNAAADKQGAVSETESQYVSETIYGQVTEMMDNEITVTLGTLSSLKDVMENDEEFAQKPSGEIPEETAGKQDMEKPDGEKPDGEKPEGAPEGGPDKEPAPDGGAMPGSVFTASEETYTFIAEDGLIIYLEKAQAEAEASIESGTMDDIQSESILGIEFDSKGNISSLTVLDVVSSKEMEQSRMQGQGMNQGQASGVDSYDAVTVYTEDSSVNNEAYVSDGTDENAVLVQGGANVVMTDITLERISKDSTGGDASSFYGVGAGLLVTDGTVYVTGANVTTDAAGGAGIFSYGDGTAYLADSSIDTTSNTSGGIHVAGGGTLYAWNLDVETDGASSAAIRSDRGSGTMVVDGGSYTSNGTGSPAVYCTADITINNAALEATGSEAVCIEGFNSLRLFDSELTGNMPQNDQNDCIWTIILYQSMSGDSEIGNSSFEMTGGSINSENGGLFYTTNTECTITLEDVNINYPDNSEFFLQCTGNTNERGWGSSTNNGSDCIFTGIRQDIAGDVIWDTISNLDFYLIEGSTLTGAFVNDNTYAGQGGEGYANLYISKNSTWVVTKDSTISSLYSEGNIVDESGETVSVVGEDGVVYSKGTSDITITVSQYSDTVDLSEAGSTSDYASYAVEKPEKLQ